MDGVAVVAEAAQERFGHGPVAEEIRPFVICQIRCNDRGVTAIALLHQFEKDVGLFRLQIQIASLVHAKQMQASQALYQFARRAIGKRSVHLIE